MMTIVAQVIDGTCTNGPLVLYTPSIVPSSYVLHKSTYPVTNVKERKKSCFIELFFRCDNISK